MRQVDLDELTYQISSGLRGWTWTVRKQLFAPIHLRRDTHLSVAADKVCQKLRIWTFIDPAMPGAALKLEQVSAIFAEAIPHFPGAIAGLWLSGVEAREKEAKAAAAILLADAIANLEVLSETSLVHLGGHVTRFPAIDAPAHAFQPRWP